MEAQGHPGCQWRTQAIREVRLEMHCYSFGPLHKPVSDPTGGIVYACMHVCTCVLCGYVLHNVPPHIPMHVLRIERKAKQNSLEEVSVTHRRGTSLPCEEQALFARLTSFLGDPPGMPLYVPPTKREVTCLL